MPEGDTIYRSARTLEQWIGGQMVTGATLLRLGLHAGDVLAGTMVTSISAHGKHLFIYFSERLVLHSHMGMSGEWPPKVRCPCGSLRELWQDLNSRTGLPSVTWPQFWTSGRREAYRR